MLQKVYIKTCQQESALYLLTRKTDSIVGCSSISCGIVVVTCLVNDALSSAFHKLTVYIFV